MFQFFFFLTNYLIDQDFREYGYVETNYVRVWISRVNLYQIILYNFDFSVLLELKWMQC